RFPLPAIKVASGLATPHCRQLFTARPLAAIDDAHGAGQAAEPTFPSHPRRRSGARVRGCWRILRAVPVSTEPPFGPPLKRRQNLYGVFVAFQSGAGCEPTIGGEDAPLAVTL